MEWSSQRPSYHSTPTEQPGPHLPGAGDRQGSVLPGVHRSKQTWLQGRRAQQRPAAVLGRRVMGVGAAAVGRDLRLRPRLGAVS